MAPYNKPRIVEERSPWGDFLVDLPDTIRSFSQLNQQLAFQAQEAEKNRQFQESQVYLTSMLTTERDLTNRIYDKMDDAEDYGLNVTSVIDSMDTLNATEGGSKLSQLGTDQIQQSLDSLKNIHSNLSQDISLFNKGKLVSDIIDADEDGFLSGDEFLEYQNKLQETDPEYALPEALKLGAQYAITDPVNRMRKLELEKVGLGIEQATLGIEQTKLQTQFAKTAEARQVTAEARASGEYELQILDKYSEQKLTTMTGEYSTGDYSMSSYFSNLFKGLSKPEIMTLIEQSPQEYQDIIPQDVDYSDFQNAIAPQMAEIVAANIASNGDIDVLGLTIEDVESSSPEFQNVVAKGVLNAMSGFEQNPNYKYKSDIEVTQAKVFEAQSQAVIDKDFEVSMAQAVPTIEAAFLNADKKVTADFDAIAEATGLTEERVQAIISSLVIQKDPTTLALMMRESGDYVKVLNAAGLKTLASVVAVAGKSKAKSRGKYKSKARITSAQANEYEQLIQQRQDSQELISQIEAKHSDVMSDPLSTTGSVGWAGESSMPIPLIALELQKLSLDLLQTSEPNEADAIRARMMELEHFLDQAKKGK